MATATKNRIDELESRLEQLEQMVEQFVPVDDEGEYTQEFLEGMRESQKDVENGRVTEITSLEDWRVGQ